VTVNKCFGFGGPCEIQRDDIHKPKKVKVWPCCQDLTCQGFGPGEITSGTGAATGADYLRYSGICSYSLDNGNTQFGGSGKPGKPNKPVNG